MGLGLVAGAAVGLLIGYALLKASEASERKEERRRGQHTYIHYIREKN